MHTSRLADASRGLRHVFLRDILLSAQIGVHAHEHHRTQRLRINLDLAVEDQAALAASRAPVGADSLSRVVDYEHLARLVRGIAAAGHVNLVETLAERIAQACLQDDRIVVARVRVEKLDVFDDIGAAGVEIERRRG